MISKEFFTDNYDREFVPYQGYYKVLDEERKTKDPFVASPSGPFEIVTVDPQFSTSHLTFNLKDKDGKMMLDRNVRKITYYEEGYYLLEDDNEDDLLRKYAGRGSFPGNEYVSSMNVMDNKGVLLSDKFEVNHKWFNEVIPDLGFVKVRYEANRWVNLKLSGEPFIIEKYVLKFGCYVLPSPEGYAVYSSSLCKKITDNYSSVMWADPYVWNVRVVKDGKHKVFLHGQGNAIIAYAHEILIKPNVIALLEKDGIWYIYDSLGRTIECLRWNPISINW